MANGCWSQRSKINKQNTDEIRQQPRTHEKKRRMNYEQGLTQSAYVSTHLFVELQGR
jgi:hypothetical protein